MSKIFRKDFTGKKLGKLTVIKFTKNASHDSYWLCHCECGNRRIICAGDLQRRNKKSCGCLQKTHGMTSARVYGVWSSMIKRCSNKNHKDFKYYGGRGIKVCKRWHKFENFFEDMGHPNSNLSLDRINNNSNYSPDNCRWATQSEQANNKRNTVLIKYKDKIKTLMQWSKDLNINRKTLSGRIRRGWSVEKAIETPVT